MEETYADAYTEQLPENEAANTSVDECWSHLKTMNLERAKVHVGQLKSKPKNNWFDE